MKKISARKKIKRIKRNVRYEKRKFSRFAGKTQSNVVILPDLLAAKSLLKKQYAVVGSYDGETKKVPYYGRRRVYDIPNSLDFEHNYCESLQCFLGLRAMRTNQKKYKFNYYLEFEALNKISPSALLVLAAELDCRLGPASTRKGRKLIPADSNRWEPHITALFNDFGIFDLLQARPNLRMTYGKDLQAVSFRRGQTQDGSAVDELIEDIVKLSNKRPNEGERLYEGLGEAVANVLDHAYPHPHVSYPAKRIPAWWAGAIYDETIHTTYFMVYDRGVGLPVSLPNAKGFRALFESLGLTDATDADLIWAATQKPKSGTELEYRGEGLKQMAEVVDNHAGSSLQILSGCGSMTYLGGKKKILKALPVEFCGTLVEWRIKHD